MSFIKKILDKTSDWILANTDNKYEEALNYWNNKINFHDRFKHTVYWAYTDSEEAFIKNNPPGYTATSITYCFDHSMFRGHSEEDLNSNSIANTVACFGCSQTFGVGLKYEDTWPYKLKELTDNKILVKNYGISGASSDKISRLVYNYLLNNKPLAVCCLLPDVFRREMIDNSGSNIMQEYAKYGCKHNKDDWEAYNRLANEPNSYYNFIKNILFIENVCKANNIKCYTLAWDPNFLKMYQACTLSFESFVGTFNDNKYKYLTSWEIERARDMVHFAPAYCSLYAELFYNRMNQDNIW